MDQVSGRRFARLAEVAIEVQQEDRQHAEEERARAQGKPSRRSL